MEKIIESPLYTPHFSGHETFPLRQTWLKKAFDQQNKEGVVDKSIFTDASAIASFGVGKNMVSSIKHWAIACRVLEESSEMRTVFLLGALGKAIFSEDGFDPYAEDAATAWLMHWCLAGEGHRATTWFWVFNRITTPSFTREDLRKPLSDYALFKNQKLSTTTLTRDIETCIRSYVPRVGGESTEDIAEPMLGELGLIQEEQKGVFSFRRGPKITLADGVFAYALTNYWHRTAATESSMAFESIAYGDGSPGRVFKLDEDSVAERLFALSSLTRGRLVWDDTAGLRQVIRKTQDFSKLELDMLRVAYE